MPRVMPRLTGTVVATTTNQPAAWAYVQVRNLAGDFQGEVRADGDGRFVLHPAPGRWRLVAWVPGRGTPSRRSPSGSRTWTSGSSWPSTWRLGQSGRSRTRPLRRHQPAWSRGRCCSRCWLLTRGGGPVGGAAVVIDRGDRAEAAGCPGVGSSSRLGWRMA